MSSLQRNRRGFSLLEVLIACGILVVGLSSIAALLPAAASRLAQATAMDRAVATAAIAMSEIEDRGLVSTEMFSTPSTGVAIVFGEMMPLITSTTTTRFQVPADSLNRVVATTTGSTMSLTAGGNTRLRLSVANAAFLDGATNGPRRFLTDDDLVYGPPTSQPTPSNAFTLVVSTTTGTTGYRAFNTDLRWGGLLVPEPWGVSSADMRAATVSVAVFRKQGTAAALTLTESGSGTGIFTTGSAIRASVRRTYLRGCSWVLAMPPPSALIGPRWVNIRSSWTPGDTVLTTGSGVAYVVFEQPVHEDLIRKVGTVRSMCVIGFDSLLLVDEKCVPIR